MAWIIKLTDLIFRISKKIHVFTNHAISFWSNSYGNGNKYFITRCNNFFSLFFIVAFSLSSKNMDSDAIMNWMMKKPEKWIGNKKS